MAIQKLSQEINERRLYAHLGWREINGRWVYLHAGGAIGVDGAVSGVAVEVSDALAHFQLPAPLSGQELIDVIRKGLRILTVAPKSITVPGFAAVFRAPLGNTPFSLHYAGQTGEGKTELAALFQRFYGSMMDALHLPANWSSTGNSLEGLACEAKDALLVVDDFAPSGAAADVQRYHKEADRLLRAQGNRSGRLRMRADGSLRPAKPPRGLIVSTGEDVPRGHSIRARTLVVEISPGDIDWPVLSQCQQEAAAGVYAAVLAAYLQWLASRYKEIQTSLPNEVQQLRALASTDSEHKRTPDIAANLAIGLRHFLAFAREKGAVTQDQADILWTESWRALLTAAQAQSAHHAASDPARRFIELVGAAIASGRAHVADPDGRAPHDARAWGWREKTIGTGEYQREEEQPQGELIGWLDSKALYLEPDASFAVAQHLARDQGESLSVTPQTLRKRLKERGYLASWDHATQIVTIRRVLEGKKKYVLHLRQDVFTEGLSPDKEPGKPSTAPSGSENRQNASEDPAKNPSILPDNLTNPASHPAPENQAKPNGYQQNAGNAGFWVAGKNPGEPQQKGDGKNGTNGAEDAGVSESKNPAPGTGNPAAASVWGMSYE